MGFLSNILAEKKSQRRQHLAAAEVLAKQMNDLEKEIKGNKTAAPELAVKKPMPACTQQVRLWLTCWNAISICYGRPKGLNDKGYQL